MDGIGSHAKADSKRKAMNQRTSAIVKAELVGEEEWCNPLQCGIDFDDKLGPESTSEGIGS